MRSAYYGAREEGGVSGAGSFNPSLYYTKTESDVRYLRKDGATSLNQSVGGSVTLLAARGFAGGGVVSLTCTDPTDYSTLLVQSDDAMRLLGFFTGNSTSTDLRGYLDFTGGVMLVGSNGPNTSAGLYATNLNNPWNSFGVRVGRTAAGLLGVEFFSADDTVVETGGGNAVAKVVNRTTAPTTSPTSGAFFYAEGGALRAYGSSGTVTVMAPA